MRHEDAMGMGLGIGWHDFERAAAGHVAKIRAWADALEAEYALRTAYWRHELTDGPAPDGPATCRAIEAAEDAAADVPAAERQVHRLHVGLRHQAGLRGLPQEPPEPPAEPTSEAP